MKVRKTRRVTAILIILACATCVTSQAARKGFHGTVKSMDMENRVLTVERDGKAREFTLPKSLSIRTSREIALSDVPEGAYTRCSGPVSKDQTEIKCLNVYVYDSGKGSPRLDDTHAYGTFALRDGTPTITAKGKTLEIKPRESELTYVQMAYVDEGAIQEGRKINVRAEKKDGKWNVKQIIVELPEEERGGNEN